MESFHFLIESIAMKLPAKPNETDVKMGRRYKSYPAETGTSYQYFFDTQRRVNRPEGQGPGVDFAFVITADQRPPFTLRVFVSERAITAWRDAHQTPLSANEQYAAAKMRLFRAFDELENLNQHPLSLIVDETNVEDLLQPLDLV
jgi:hypothetical protein